MKPLTGQNVYSADGTRYLGKVGDFHRALRSGQLGWWVYLTTPAGSSVPAHVIEWDRALGGWLER